LGIVVAASVHAALDPARLETWNLPRASLYAVTTQGQNAWAVGYWGTVLRSTDAGRTWSETRTPTARTLFAVSFADDKTGWAVGASGTLLRSTDGGATWTAQPVQIQDEMGGTRPLDVNLFGVAALSPTEAWAVGDLGTVLHTRDGENWEKVVFDAATYADDNVPERILNAVVFTSPMDGWIAGEFATLLRTSDGGQTWVGQRTIEGAPPDLYLFNLSASPAGGSAAAVGLAGSVLVTSDSGTVWDSRSVDTTAGLFAIAWRGQQGVAVGDRGVLYVTSDGGQTWTDSKRPKLFNWLAGAVLGDGVGLVVGEGGLVLRSEDSGATWVAATTPSTPSEPPLKAVGGTEPAHE